MPSVPTVREALDGLTRMQREQTAAMRDLVTEIAALTAEADRLASPVRDGVRTWFLADPDPEAILLRMEEQGRDAPMRGLRWARGQRAKETEKWTEVMDATSPEALAAPRARLALSRASLEKAAAEIEALSPFVADIESTFGTGTARYTSMGLVNLMADRDFVERYRSMGKIARFLSPEARAMLALSARRAGAGADAFDEARRLVDAIRTREQETPVSKSASTEIAAREKDRVEAASRLSALPDETDLMARACDRLLSELETHEGTTALKDAMGTDFDASWVEGLTRRSELRQAAEVLRSRRNAVDTFRERLEKPIRDLRRAVASSPRTPLHGFDLEKLQHSWGTVGSGVRRGRQSAEAMRLSPGSTVRRGDDGGDAETGIDVSSPASLAALRGILPGDVGEGLRMPVAPAIDMPRVEIPNVVVTVQDVPSGWGGSTGDAGSSGMDSSPSSCDP